MRTLWIDTWKDVRKTKNEDQPFKYPVSVDHAAEIIGRKESPASLLSLLAEECSECAHAALKLARIIRQESPTPESGEVAFDHHPDIKCQGRLLNIIFQTQPMGRENQ